jgi:hypothetical protein
MIWIPWCMDSAVGYINSPPTISLLSPSNTISVCLTSERDDDCCM